MSDNQNKEVLSLDELNQKIEQWFHDKGIIEKSNPIKQLGKTREEITEIRDAYMKLKVSRKYLGILGCTEITLKELTHEVKDGIGDTYVTLVGVCMMCRTGNESAHPIDYFESMAKDRISEIGNLGVVELLDLIEETFLNLYYDMAMDHMTSNHDINRHYYNISMMLSILVILALHFDTTIEACVQQAYDVISKRTGKMVDGIFVKDA